VIARDGLMDNAKRLGEAIREGLKRELAGVAGVKDVRGEGLMIGVELDRPCGELVRRALAAGLVINVTADRVIRLLPPLVLDAAQARLLVETLAPLVRAFLAEAKAA